MKQQIHDIILSGINLIHGDCLEEMKNIPDNSIDLTITSPPYDNLRTYGGVIDGWSFEKFQGIARELYRITKDGGVVVWVVADATIKGSETGTSFKQALYFMECGFNLHDTMIWQKASYVPLTHNRYEQEFEYMFVFSRGKVQTFNPIKVECKYAGTTTWGDASFHKTNDSGLIKVGKKVVNDTKIKGNVFRYDTAKASRKGEYGGHPAPFPEALANDHILSWSNAGDTVFDPFTGSGTTGKMAILNNRNFIGIELNEEYFKIAEKRINNAIADKQSRLF
jgi:site-specific DNA-methyltransferase (adenine-specific)